MTETPLDKIKKSNDAYHKAIDGMFESDDYMVEQKTAVGVNANNIFELMERVIKTLDVPEEIVEPKD